MGRVVALLTDFGVESVYVGIMKGVILGIAPEAVVVDVSHGVGKFDVDEGAFLLYVSYRYFPRGTVFVGVVDPGVGSARRGIAIESRNYFFVGPDNGLLLPAAEEDGIVKVVSLENPEFFLKPISATFHGRDIFAPVAAWIARGVSLEVLGSTIDVRTLARPSLRIGYRRRVGDFLELEVVHIDSFGNVVLGSRFEDVARELGISRGDIVEVIPGCKGRSFEAVVARSFSDVEPGRMIFYQDSFDMAELALNRGSASDLLEVSRGSKVCVGRAN